MKMKLRHWAIFMCLAALVTLPLTTCQVDPTANDPKLNFSISGMAVVQWSYFSVSVWLLENTGNGDAQRISETLELYALDQTTQIPWFYDTRTGDPDFPAFVEAGYSNLNKSYSYDGYTATIPYYYKFTVTYEDVDGNQMEPVVKSGQVQLYP
jgi:hypothetical protein